MDTLHTFRFEPSFHSLTNRGEICAALIVSGEAICFGWGRSWQDAVRMCHLKFRRIRTSSRLMAAADAANTKKAA